MYMYCAVCTVHANSRFNVWTDRMYLSEAITSFGVFLSEKFAYRKCRYGIIDYADYANL